MTKGVIYYNAGTACCVRLLVSIYSLRKVYSGPIAILSEGSESHALCQLIASAMKCDFLEIDLKIPPGKNRVLLAKPKIHEVAPYDINLWIDADTLILRAFNEIFDIIEANKFVVAPISDWSTQFRRITNRINKWLKFFPELVPAAVAYGTAINCGVVGFTKDADIFRQWYDKALIGRDFFIADETCAQLLLPHVQHKIVSDDYNKSCKYGQLTDTTKIIHYHGKKHCRTVGNDYVYKGELWVRVYQEIVSLNVCDIQTWQPAGDIRLKRLMQNINISKPQRHIFDNFDKCFYINLDHRQDKNDLIQTELNKHGIVAERVSGIDDKNKKQGCTLSHIKVLKLAQEQKLDSILIMEDDVKFHDDIKEVSIAIRNFLQKNPWDIIFFHISNATKFINGPIKLDNKYKIIRTNGARGTQCYAVRHTAYDAIISELSKRPWKYNDGTMMKHICRKFITYGITPVLAGQRCDTISDIKNKTNGKDWIFASEWPERY